ncbi:MAG: dihydrofolate reductase family protein [Gemmatimonadaceae bacterium]
MQKLIVFNSVTLDGYFTGPNGDLSWAHAKPDPEWDKFVAGNAKGGGTLLFGRVTYDMMVAFWPTPNAAKAFPDVAKGMNEAQKVVFSRTLDNSPWKNTRIVKDGMVAEVRKMKTAPGKGLTILGSGKIVSQLAGESLIDEYQLVVTPVALGNGRTMFDGMKNKLGLKRTSAREFGNGNTFLTYIPAS